MPEAWTIAAGVAVVLMALVTIWLRPTEKPTENDDDWWWTIR